jgi:hypothetical protein
VQKRTFGRNEGLFLAVSFFTWLACCVSGLCARYYGQRRFTARDGDDEARLFEDAVEETKDGDVRTEEDEVETPTADNQPVQQDPLLVEDRAKCRNASKRTSWSHYLDDSGKTSFSIDCRSLSPSLT